MALTTTAIPLSEPVLQLKRLLPTGAPQFYYLLYSTLLLSLVLPTYRLIHRDYHRFLALGPGGTPSTFPGYLRITYLRLFALRNPFIPPPLLPNLRPASPYLFTLPHRAGPRPHVAGIAPQRQTNQKSSPDMHHAMRHALHGLAATHPTRLRTGVSCFEKNGLALNFAPARTSTHQQALNPTCGSSGEACHIHATDGSMHLTLHPSDAALVIAQGWGQRHPLSGGGLFGVEYVPRGFVMVYAPRWEEEVGVLMEIVRAGVWWVGGCVVGRGKRGNGAGVMGCTSLGDEGGEEGVVD